MYPPLECQKHEENDEHKELGHIYIKNKNGREKQDLFIWCAFPLYQVLFSKKIKEAIHEMASKKKSNKKFGQKLKSIFRTRKKTQSIKEFYEEKVNFIINHFDPIKLFDRICINNPNIYLFDNLDRAKKLFPKTIIPKIKSNVSTILVDAFKQYAKNTSYIIFSVKTLPDLLACWFDLTMFPFKYPGYFAAMTKKIQKHICGFMLYHGKTFRQCRARKYKYNSTAVIIRGKICVANNTTTWKTFRNNQKLVEHLKRLLCLSSLFIKQSTNPLVQRLPYDCMKCIFYYLGGDANRYPKENFKLVSFFATNAKNIEENIKEFKHPTFVVGNDKIELIDKKDCEKLFKLV